MLKLKLKDFIPPAAYYIYMHLIVKLSGDNRNYYHTQLPQFISPIFESYSGRTHEDLLIDYLLGFKTKGFYVDVGANDPDFPGHTKRFSLKGWTGINIEPQKHLSDRLIKKRPKDITLNIAVDTKEGEVTMYEIPEQNVGTSLNPTMAKLTSVWHKNAKIIEQKIPALRLESVLEKHAKDKDIDFMNIDTEGTELSVLKSNNWKRFRPKLLIIEIVHFDREEIIDYLKKQNYTLIFLNDTNGIFKDNGWKI